MFAGNDRVIDPATMLAAVTSGKDLKDTEASVMNIAGLTMS